jgi:hypothetical protein
MNEENLNPEEQENAAAQESVNESPEETAVTEEQITETEAPDVFDEQAYEEAVNEEAVEAFVDSEDAVNAEGDITAENEENALVTEKETKKKNTAIMAVVIAVVVLALAAVIYFLVGRSNPYTKDYIDTTGRTAADVADEMGMEYKDFLENFGLPEDMPESTSENATFYNIPLSSYVEMVGVSFDQLKEIFGWDDTITEETTVGDAFDATTVGKRVGEDQLEAFKAEYGLDDSVTADTLWGEIRNIVDMKLKEQTEAEKAASEEEPTENADSAEEQTDDSQTDEAQTEDTASEESADTETVE